MWKEKAIMPDASTSNVIQINHAMIPKNGKNVSVIAMPFGGMTLPVGTRDDVVNGH